jgi:23S rRNA (uracil1939-C5)-methyltransferase
MDLTEPHITELPAEDRATPSCPHFGPCGGCQLQHLTYPAQLALKAAQLRTLLEPTNLTLPELQLHPSPPLAYRNRIRLTLAEVDGQLRAGYIRNPTNEIVIPTEAGWPILSQSHRDRVGYRAELDRSPSTASQLSAANTFLPITQCPIAAPILWRAAETFLTLINESPGSWLRTPNQLLDQLELFTTANESALQLTLYLRTQSKTAPTKRTTTFNTLCETLRIQIPELTGAGIALLPVASPDRSRRTEVPKPGPTWGTPGLNYPVDDTTYWVPRTAFFQINRYLIPELRTLITANRTGQLAWDLYAGVGLFSKALAATFTQVTAVEIAEPAAAALAATKLPNLQAIQATTLDFLRTNVIQRDRPDLIVLDPPRSGAGPEICALLARVAAPTLIYVSCSPQHLAADLIPLAASGYTLTELHLLDLFPQTTHLETVAILTR